MRKVYITHTVYHVYITLLKALCDTEIDIILIDTIDNYKELSDRLNESGIFNSVMSINRQEKFGKRYRTFLQNYLNNRIHKKRIKREFEFLKAYDEVYIYNDYSEIGDLLELYGIQYHLLEDGLDWYKQCDIYEDIGHFYALKKILYKLFSIPYSQGMNKKCLDIEVNDDGNLKTTIKKPVLSVARAKLQERIPDEYLLKIYKVFGVNEVNAPEKKSGKKLLLLTQILKELLVVNTDSDQISLYDQAISKYGAEYTIYFKPHPRDSIDYSSLIKKYSAVLLEKNIPMEVYRSLPGMHFDIVLTYSSTAANMGNLGDVIVRLDERI